jgi:micrococcal nuclease
MHVKARIFGGTAVGLVLVSFVMAQSPAPQAPGGQARGEQPAAKPQARPHGQRVRVDPAAVTVEDGDGVIIHWNEKDSEIVRILGIDTPEIRRLEHDLPYDQPFGPEAKAFAQGAVAAATEIELLRAATLDP